ncbi:MAG: hypothetical protein ABSA26_09505 [Thermoguttaceae bacterium]
MDFSFSRRQEYLYILLIRDMSVAERFWISWSLTKFVINRQREKIAHEYPEYSPLEVKQQWAEIAYGKELIDEVRASLAQREIPAEWNESYLLY